MFIYIYNNQDDHDLFDIRLDLIRVSESVNTLEEKFIETFRNYIRHTDPNAQDWQLYKKDKKFRERNLKSLSSPETIDLIAELEVGKIANYAGVKLNSEDKTTYAKVIKENFNLHIIMRINILKKIIISGLDFAKKKNANLFWDMEIASCVQTGNFHNPDRFSLITNDKAILDAAMECNCRDKVLTLNEYNKYLSD